MQNQGKDCVGSNSFLFVNALKLYQFNAKDSEIKPYPLYLGSFSKDFTINDMEKIGVKRYNYVFSVRYNIIDIKYSLDIHNFLMTKRRNSN